MNIFHKLLLLSAIPASFVLFDFLPIVECSSNEHNQGGAHKSLNHNAYKVNAQTTFDITVHGILLWVSMGFFMPLGILIIRFLNKEENCCQRLKLLFYFHAIVQVVAVLLATAGAVLSITNFENSFCNAHQRIGLALYAAVWVQALIGLRRPKRGSKARSVWYFFHWIFGTTVSLLGILNIYTGLRAYHKRTSKPIRLWTILFAAQISIMALFYLFQDKWAYILKQGVILGNEPTTPSNQILPQIEDQKEVLTHVQCRKSNALSSYFAKSNVLKKLLQLTRILVLLDGDYGK